MFRRNKYIFMNEIIINYEEKMTDSIQKKIEKSNTI